MAGGMYTKMTSTGSSLIVNPRSISKELEAKISAAIAKVIASHDVAKLTTKLVRQSVEKEVHVSLTSHKDVLKRLMHQELRKLKAKKVAKRTVPEPWKNAKRRESVVRALNRVYQLAKEAPSFPPWGLHAIQSLYDLQTVERGPVLRLATLYARLIGAMWLKEDRHQDWAPGSAPTPSQLVDVITSVYLIERTGICHSRRAELLEFWDQTPAVCGPKELLGWNPVNETPLQDEKSGASVYERLTGALLLWHYANALGISIGFTLPQLLQHLVSVYPYKGPNELSPRHYEDQVHLVTTLVFVLSSQGRLRCETDLLPHEYLFLRHHIVYHLALQNIALIGEILRALQCFEGSSNLVHVRRGLAFLLVTQQEDGSWQADSTQNDTTQRYFATVQALWALSEPHRAGFAPAFPEATPILELHLNADISNIGNISEDTTFSSSVDGTKSTSDFVSSQTNADAEVAAATANGPSEDEDVATRVSFLQGLLEQNGNVKNVSAALATHVLKTLTDMALTVDILKNTGIGRTINKLRKHSTPAVAKGATSLVAKWKKDLL